MSGGFVLTVTARPAAVVSLIVVLVAAALLTVGWRLAVHRRYEAHRWVQTVAACLNAALVVAWMIRSFVVNVWPELPARLGQTSYATATAHAVTGVIGVALGSFVVLRANGLVPERLAFHDYKLFMRTSYGLYLLATLTGVVLYGVAYGFSLR
ncbi:MAG TPA: hypothetical protein VL117_12780 [Thermoleophilia bacterium]|nr:hypothetical protein [Thermoleophilia bacterium]